MKYISILCYTISNINTSRRHTINSTLETMQLFGCIKQLSDCAVEKLLKVALEALNLESIDFEISPYCECYKGKELPPDVDRSARKHGAKAQKRGISNEYICINIGVQRERGVVAKTVNRAKLSKTELEQVYGGYIGNGNPILCDG